METPPFPDVEDNSADQPLDMTFATLSALDDNANDGFINYGMNFDWDEFVHNVNGAFHEAVNNPVTPGSELIVCEPAILPENDE